MMRSLARSLHLPRSSFLVLLSSFLVPLSAPAQSIAQRVAAARDGDVQMTYASRPEVCGDGAGTIAETGGADGVTIYSRDGSTITTGPYGRTNLRDRCERGPARVVVTVESGRVTEVRASVGPAVASRSAVDTDLGVVPAAEAARWLLDVARTSPEHASRNAFLAAWIADSARLAPTLGALARDRSLREGVRERALRWLGRAAEREDDRDAAGTVRAIAAADDEPVSLRERAIRVAGEMDGGPDYLRGLYPRLSEHSLRERVVRVVAEDPTTANVAWLRERALDANERTAIRERALRELGEVGRAGELRTLYTRLDQHALRERVIRVVAEEGGTGSGEWLRGVAERDDEPVALRERAIRSLGERAEHEYLRQLYPRLRERSLRERVLRTLGEAGGSEGLAFLRRVALDPTESHSLRERAVRSLAEAGLASADMAKLYDEVDHRQVRERLINLLAERGDRAAREKLQAIARGETDQDLRRRALKKLGEIASQ